MAEDKITAAETANEGTKKSENIVELAKPYVFEGKEYGEIDLTGLEKLTVQDAIDVQRQLFGEGEAVMVNVDDCNLRASRVAYGESRRRETHRTRSAENRELSALFRSVGALVVGIIGVVEPLEAAENTAYRLDERALVPPLAGEREKTAALDDD